MALAEREIRVTSPGPPPGRSDFAALVTAAQAGDHSAYAALYARSAGELLGFLRARGTPEPEEVVNDVFVAAFNGLADFAGDEHGFRAWIFQIGRHKRVDALRRLARTPDTAPLENHGAFSAGGDVEAEAIGLLADDTLRTLLEPLTPDQRDVLLLRVVADLSLAQTAAVLNKRVGAVKAMQHRALEQLRRL